MKTVHEVSRQTGVSIRALQYYDQIGLLSPSMRTEAGYRLYDDAALERLQQILLFRELEFSLDEIRTILNAPDFDREKALTQQIELLTMKKERLERIIAFAREIQQRGEMNMNFDAFDSEKIEEYAARAKAQWGDTAAYAEYERKAAHRSAADQKQIAAGLTEIFAEFGRIRESAAADSPEAAALVKKLQAYITEHYYHCTDEILAGLGAMYAADGEFRQNIDKAGGEGTAAFASRAIAAYCHR